MHAYSRDAGMERLEPAATVRSWSTLAGTAPLIEPSEKLGGAVDLVVVVSVRKRHELGQVIVEPGGPFRREQNLAAFDEHRADAHPGDLIGDGGRQGRSQRLFIPRRRFPVGPQDPAGRSRGPRR